MEFRCIQDCSECCIKREYYPSKRYGKIGVLILPNEVDRIKKMAVENNIQVKILPRVGISKDGNNDSEHAPTKILAYQLMGVEEDGDVCPFLDTESEERSPHGGLVCKIYKDRPLACTAYPLIESDPVTLDQKCKFCKECKTADSNLDTEAEALSRIKEEMMVVGTQDSRTVIWRFATGVGEAEDRKTVQFGWIRETDTDD